MRFSITSRPQTGQGPRFARSIFTPFSLSSSATVSPVNLTMSDMNFPRESSPRSICPSRCSQSPVRPADVSGCSPRRRITWIPFSVARSARPSRSMYPTSISRSMIAARVAGVPIPESFIASRSSASSMSFPAASIAPRSEASV